MPNHLHMILIIDNDLILDEKCRDVPLEHLNKNNQNLNEDNQYLNKNFSKQDVQMRDVQVPV